MPEVWRICIAAIGVVLALGLIVSMTLAHYIGGFFQTVEREAQKDAEDGRTTQQTGASAEAEQKQEN